jgi:quercetin dioxygenase-like cupin family protein
MWRNVLGGIMNRHLHNASRFVVALAFAALAGSGVALAQDKAAAAKAQAPAKGEPTVTKLIENESVIASDVTFKPGDLSAMRLRPARVIHYVTSGEMTVTYQDGKSEVRKFKAGDTVWRAAENIEAKNATKKPIRLVQVIPKSAPAK